MKKIFVALCAMFAMNASAQSLDPVLLTVNGKPITRGEFEYSFNKNTSVEGAVEKKTVDEYIDMFINYKLKVAAAEDAKMDTASSFLNEFHQYRDMQLTPYMVDQTFIDSIAHVVYNRTADQLKGKDMLRVAHILIAFGQNAADSEKAAAKAKADSLYQQIVGGGDFSALAKAYSQDPGSASRGGELPWVGPGMTLKEFETTAYSLKTGEVSKVFSSAVGFHIVKMLERKQLEPFEQLKPEILTSLKKQGIEEASAQNKIQKIVEGSNGRLTRSDVMDSILNAHVDSNLDLKYLVQEYHDGLLLYEASKKEVWDVAAADTKGLEKWFKANKKKYAWDEPRFKGFVYYSKLPKLDKKITKVLKKNEDGDWRAAIRKTFNQDSMVVRVSGPYLCKEGENPHIDKYVFDGKDVPANSKFPYSGVSGKKMKKPKSYLDVKSLVLNDYQEKLEKEWIEKLRQKYSFEVNREVLKTVNKH